MYMSHYHFFYAYYTVLLYGLICIRRVYIYINRVFNTLCAGNGSTKTDRQKHTKQIRVLLGEIPIFWQVQFCTMLIINPIYCFYSSLIINVSIHVEVRYNVDSTIVTTCYGVDWLSH